MIRPKVCSFAIALLGAAACGSGPDDPAPDAEVTDDLTPELRLAVDASLDHVDANAAVLGLRGRGDLRLVRAIVDDLGLTHTRFQQTIDGVPVFGGEGIVHLRRDRSITTVTDAFVPRIAVSTTPELSAGDAIARALPDGRAAASLATPPAAELWAMRHAGRDRLVWRVQLRLDEGTNRISLPVVFVDAHDGSVVWQYDNLQTGTGPSLYSGTQTFDTTPNAGLHYMEDRPRKLGTFDMRNGSSLYRFDDTDDVWDTAAQRAAIDVHLGTQQAYEYWKTVHGRDGIDGIGGPGPQLAVDEVTRLITSRVHYGINYSNAFWDGTQMTYGDGDGTTYSPLVTLDIVGHEMMHGITQHTAGLVYAGESGALNESYSDIFGAMVERYARGESEAIWKVGDEYYTPAIPGDASRYMDAPHQARNKGLTADDDPDHYSERYTGGGDNGGVHINSGIGNKAFYLLAMGGAHHLGGAMTGIGADRAAAIWYKALTTYLTSTAGFAHAARATYEAAVALHGEGSAEAAAVVSAWGLTGVGLDLVAPAVAITAPGDGAQIVAPLPITVSPTDDVAVTAVQFLIDGAVIGTATTSPFSYTWNTVASGNGPHTITARAFDAAGNSAVSATIHVTVDHEAIPPAVAITAPADGATVANTVTVAVDATDNIAVDRVDLWIDGAFHRTDRAAPYSFTWNTPPLADGPHVLVATAFDTVGNSTSSAVTVITDNDRLPPVVAITAPAAGAVVENTVTIEVAASDNVAVTYVAFYAGSTILGVDETAPYSFAWNTHRFPDGSYVLTARARDALDNIGTSTVTITVDNDSTPPTVALTSPAPGSALSGTVTATAEASDNVAVTRVELVVNGIVVATDTAAPWQFVWDTAGSGNGTLSVVARAFDALNNSTTSSVVAVTADNPGLATYDPALRVPRCATVGSICDTGGLVIGRADVGPEPNTPNTLGGTCLDGSSGVYHYDESLDRLRVFTADGRPITAGKPITIEARAWAQTGPNTALDLYHTATPDSPVWTLIGSFGAGASGARTLSTTFMLPAGTHHAIRGQLRYAGGPANPCYLSTRNDRDDLVFAATGAVDTTPPMTSIIAPAGAKVRGVATVTAGATDNVGVTAVELYVGGAKVATATAAPYSLAWNTATIADGAHTLQARALDTAGNVGASVPVTVTVNNADSSDSTPPATSITSPAAGAVLAGTVAVTTASSDLGGIGSVELLLDGAVIAMATSAPWSFTWDTRTVANRSHTLQTRARDTAGNPGLGAALAITVDNGIGAATFDPVLQAPRCAAGYDGCDTGTLVNGRAGLGPEANAPNTLHDACADGTAGAYHASSSIDRLRVYTADGTPLAAGKTVVAEATVWNFWSSSELDVIDFYYTTSPSIPSWVYIGSVTPGSPQDLRVVTRSFTLPSGYQIAVRANMRRKAATGPDKPAACTAGPYNDHDDLVLTVGG